MEVRKGFIVGIYNYCDRWCETCDFTSRCELFADVARAEASLDPHLQALVNAPTLPEDVSPPAPPWVQEAMEEMNAAATDPDVQQRRRVLGRAERAAKLEPVCIRSMAYATRVHEWWTCHG